MRLAMAYIRPGAQGAIRRALCTLSPLKRSRDMALIQVCDQAAGESCPLFPGKPTKLHWSTPDPAKAIGSDAEIESAFDEAFCLLRKRVEELTK